MVRKQSGPKKAQRFSKRFRKRESRLRRSENGPKPTIESRRFVDVMQWQREGYLSRHSVFSCTWERNGQTIASLNVESHRNEMILARLTQTYGGELIQIRQIVSIIWMPCRFGGERPWFVCPMRNRGIDRDHKAARLFDAGEFFACRRCCGLIYRSQMETRANRDLRKAQAIRRRLKGHPSILEPFPERPKGLHRRRSARRRDTGQGRRRTNPGGGGSGEECCDRQG
jgi:hypothetical protein